MLRKKKAARKRFAGGARHTPISNEQGTNMTTKQASQVLTCAACGDCIDEPAKLAQHMRTKACQRKARRKAAERRGYRTFNSTWRTKLSEQGFEVIAVDTSSGRRRGGTVWYAEDYVSLLVGLDWDDLPHCPRNGDWNKRSQYVEALVTRALSKAKVDKEFRDTILALHRVSGGGAAGDHAVGQLVEDLWVQPVARIEEAADLCEGRGTAACGGSVLVPLW